MTAVKNEHLRRYHERQRRRRRALLGLALRTLIILGLSLWMIWTLKPRLLPSPEGPASPSPTDTVTFADP